VCHVAQSRVIQSHLDHHTLARLRCRNASHRSFVNLLLLLSSMPPLEVAFHLPVPPFALLSCPFWDRRVPSLRLRSSAGTIVSLGGGRQMLVSSILFQQTRSTTLGSVASLLPPLSRRSSNSWAMCSGGTTPRLLCARHRCSARGWHGDTGGLGGGCVGLIASAGGVSWSLVLDG
jgi:hypothetical protein